MAGATGLEPAASCVTGGWIEHEKHNWGDFLGYLQLRFTQNVSRVSWILHVATKFT